jgi:zinc D-Ala-D-Ala carboxypeptidase
MDLSPHFTLEEMTISQTGARLGIDNRPGPDALANLRRLADRLEAVRALVGRALVISSGYRSPELNRAVGGVDSSAHVQSLAADFISPPAACILVARQIAASAIGSDQLIDEHDWIHLAVAAPGRPERRQCLTLLAGGGYAEGLR